MDLVLTILALLAAVIAAGVIEKALRLPLPRPLLQIGVGAAIGAVGGLGLPLDPEVFFLLFLPPLLFLDGWRIPREEVLRDTGPILELALGLVAFTVLGLGWLMHWAIPSLPLPVAFALAAVLAPTDPLAVAAIAQRVKIPKRMMNILEGEALLNDATALVCFRFAVAAAASGAFAPAAVVGEFVWVAVLGVGVGVAFAWAASRAGGWLGRAFADDSGILILVSLLIPYAAYLLAVEIGASGILAAVAAGLALNFMDTTALPLAHTRLRGNLVWDMIAYTANGVIFVLLGEQMPAILGRADAIAAYAGHDSPWWLALYVVGVFLALGLLRLAWVGVSLHVFLFRTRATPPKARLRLIAAMAVSGVRGAVTLAAVLSLPLLTEAGDAFPARDLAIFIAMGVIVVSLAGATLALPRLLAGCEMPSESGDEAAEDAAVVAAARAALAAVERLQHVLAHDNPQAERIIQVAAQVMETYHRRIARRDGKQVEGGRWADGIEREMRLAALRAERVEIMRRVRARKLGSATARRLISALDLLETRHSGELHR
ncbi:Na+/H+ antiporter [uncultured Alphaproteobacteria bacterium]|uniref:Na+/H+ antiporter n=1 Tax=uncultured Alphaproteobacteria bacterium TaxID=91750 RepID=A0A212KHD5_9PROT|nr:Na+/H+ antiporter [uncultured Alphaproteobacteria bacterium]